MKVITLFRIKTRREFGKEKKESRRGATGALEVA